MLDVGYFARTASLIWRLKGKKNGDLFKESIVWGRCWLNDLDFNWHMNNARYLREADFGRISFLLETGLWNGIEERRKNGMKDCNMIVSAFQVQYRQSVGLGEKFSIHTRINGWDDKAFYFEQWMIINKTREMAFSLLTRFALTPRSLTPQMLVDDLGIGSIQSPPLSPSVESFKNNYRLTFEGIKSKI